MGWSGRRSTVCGKGHVWHVLQAEELTGLKLGPHSDAQVQFRRLAGDMLLAQQARVRVHACPNWRQRIFVCSMSYLKAPSVAVVRMPQKLAAAERGTDPRAQQPCAGCHCCICAEGTLPGGCFWPLSVHSSTTEAGPCLGDMGLLWRLTLAQASPVALWNIPYTTWKSKMLLPNYPSFSPSLGVGHTSLRGFPAFWAPPHLFSQAFP